MYAKFSLYLLILWEILNIMIKIPHCESLTKSYKEIYSFVEIFSIKVGWLDG